MARRGSGRPLELLEATDSGSELPSPKGRNVAERAERALEGTIEGVKSSLRTIQFRLGQGSRHDHAYEILRRLHAFAKGQGEGDSEALIVQHLTQLVNADEPLVRQILPQLVAITCRKKPPLSRLDGFLISQSSCSHDFAMETCWALLAERAPAEPELLARAEALLILVERAGRLSLHIDATPGIRRTLSMPVAKRRPEVAAAMAAARADASPPPSERSAGSACPPASAAAAQESGAEASPSRAQRVASAGADGTASAAAAAAHGCGSAGGGRGGSVVAFPTAAGSEASDSVVPETVTELQLLHLLIGISARLKSVPKSRRTKALQSALQQLDSRLQAQRAACTWHATPLHAPPAAAHPSVYHAGQGGGGRQGANVPLRVLRVCAEDALAFSTKERVPYIVYIEVASCADFDDCGFGLGLGGARGEGGGAEGGRRPRATSSCAAAMGSAAGMGGAAAAAWAGPAGGAAAAGGAQAGGGGLAGSFRMLADGLSSVGVLASPHPSAEHAARSRGANSDAGPNRRAHPPRSLTLPMQLWPRSAADDRPGGTESAGSAGGHALAEPGVSRGDASEDASGGYGGERNGGTGEEERAGGEEEHEALSRLSSRQVILRDLPREMSGSEDRADEGGGGHGGVGWTGANGGGAVGGGGGGARDDGELHPTDARSREQRAAASGQRARVFGEVFEERQARLARTSPFASCPSWRLLSVVVKANDELRQEQFAMQLITTFDIIFSRARLPLALRPYRITATGPDSGLIEGINDSVSLDHLKQRTPSCPSLAAFFREHYGGNRRPAYHRARLNFARSAAAYSIVCYLLQIKDRHNGNIMLTSDGHLVHIDFGYLLSNSPGGNLNFESAPFKLTHEYVELLGGTNSPLFRYYRYLLVRGFVEARRHREKILQLVQTTLDFGGARWPCFRAGQAAVDALRARFQPEMTMQQYTNHVITLINQAHGNFRTRCYDGYQYCCQGIA